MTNERYQSLQRSAATAWSEWRSARRRGEPSGYVEMWRDFAEDAAKRLCAFMRTHKLKGWGPMMTEIPAYDVDEREDRVSVVIPEGSWLYDKEITRRHCVLALAKIPAGLMAFDAMTGQGLRLALGSTSYTVTLIATAGAGDAEDATIRQVANRWREMRRSWGRPIGDRRAEVSARIKALCDEMAALIAELDAIDAMGR